MPGSGSSTIGSRRRPGAGPAESVTDSYPAEFASWLGMTHAFPFWKGRAALFAILRAMGIGEGDDVIVQGYTCVMAVNPIMYLGARPIFVDIEPRTYNMRPELIEKAITPATKVIIAQHTYGYAADLSAILDVAARKGLPVIEDCCLALGTTYNGRRLGTFGLASYFSFQWNKPYTSGLGGMAVTSDDALADKIAEVREAEMVRPSTREVATLTAQYVVYNAFIYPRTTALAQNVFRWLVRKGVLVGSMSDTELTPTREDGFFKGMSGMQMRAGRGKLHRVGPILEHRRRMAVVYDNLLGQRGWETPRPGPNTSPVLVRYPVRVADKHKALELAASRFVELGSWFECPLHPAGTKLEAYGYQAGMCPESERASREVVNLPLHPRANEATARRSVAFISEIGPA